MLQRTTAQAKIAKLRKRVRIVRGGASASKTYTIIPFLIDYAIKNRDVEISIVSESIPHLRRGAMRDFLNIMQMVGMFEQSRWNKQLMTYSFSSGSIIEFFSADQADKLRGARRDVLFVNECNNIDWESYHQMAIRTRRFIYLDYNPVAVFWVDTELVGDPDAEMVVLTYKDNEALDESIVKEMEKARAKAETSDYWRNWWAVYGLGQIGTVLGTIYTNYKVVDNIPEGAVLRGIGIDFGYSNDPTAIIQMFYCDSRYYFREVAYKKEMSNREIAEILKPHKVLVICDSAEPKSIAELRSYGIGAMPCEKGKDSVTHGIQVLQAVDEFYITSDSLNMIKEIRGYVWETDKNSQMKNVPVGGKDHAMDAMRYIFTKFANRKGSYDIR